MIPNKEPFAVVVNKQNIADIHVVPVQLNHLAANQIRIRIEHFGLSANNVTYAVTGDSFGYWGFFPVSPLSVPDFATGFGIIPLWGFAQVIESNHTNIAVGQRFFGYLPMASEWVMDAQQVTHFGFIDKLASRVSNSPLYDSYQWCDADPYYDPQREIWQANFRPLFLTSFALAQYLASETVETASTILLTSASSKTAIGCAMLLQQLPQLDVVGLTSSHNVAFVEQLDCYDEVLEYGQVANMRYKTPVWILDFAGNKTLLQQLQEILDHLHYTTLFIGITDIQAQQSKPPGKLKGEMFFAPDHIKLLNKMWGRERFVLEYGQAWQQVANGLQGHFEYDEFVGTAALIERYQHIIQGNIEPTKLLLGRF